MTYQAHNKLKSDSFSIIIISFCNNLLPNYQNLSPNCMQWLRRDARASFRWRTGRVYGPLKDLRFYFFPVNRAFETVLLLQKQYAMQTQTTKDHRNPNKLLKLRSWCDATANSGITDQLIKMHSTHSWIKWVLNSSISYFVVCCLQRKMFNTTKLLSPMVSFAELIMCKWAMWHW